MPASSEDAGASRLVRIWPDGRLEPLGHDSGYDTRFLVATDDEAFVLDGSGELRAVSLGTGKSEALDLNEGRVLDALYVGKRRVAVLVSRPQSSGAEDQIALVVLDRKREDKTLLRIPPPMPVTWADGRIIGCHEPTGYFFLNLWQKGVSPGQVVVVGQQDTPPQLVPLVR
jgi:hypothetical protein